MKTEVSTYHRPIKPRPKISKKLLNFVANYIWVLMTAFVLAFLTFMFMSCEQPENKYIDVRLQFGLNLEETPFGGRLSSTAADWVHFLSPTAIMDLVTTGPSGTVTTSGTFAELQGAIYTMLIGETYSFQLLPQAGLSTIQQYDGLVIEGSSGDFVVTSDPAQVIIIPGTTAQALLLIDKESFAPADPLELPTFRQWNAGGSSWLEIKPFFETPLFFYAYAGEPAFMDGVQVTTYAGIQDIMALNSNTIYFLSFSLTSDLTIDWGYPDFATVINFVL